MRRPSFAFLFVLVLGAACGSRTLDNGGTSDASTDTGDAYGDFSKCDGTSACILATPGCCGTCGAVTLASYVAIDATQSGAFRAATCTAPQPCPNCATVPNPNYLAACRSSVCTAIDLRDDALSACTTDADCRLRWGGDCCECSAAPYDLVAVATAHAADLDAILCAPATTCTRHCAPMPYPTGKQAVCNTTTSHCEVSP